MLIMKMMISSIRQKLRLRSKYYQKQNPFYFCSFFLPFALFLYFVCICGLVCTLKHTPHPTTFSFAHSIIDFIFLYERRTKKTVNNLTIIEYYFRFFLGLAIWDFEKWKSSKNHSKILIRFCIIFEIGRINGILLFWYSESYSCIFYFAA